MRVRTSKSKLGLRFYIIKTYYDTKGIERTITVEKLGSEQEIREKTGRDPMEWAKERAAFLTQQEKAENQDVSFTLSPAKLITKNYQYTFQVGYLFLQKIFYELGMDRICAFIQKNADFSFNLSDILQKLCYGRILDPRSKVGTFDFSKKLLQQPDFEVHQMYRALDVLADNFDDIQAKLYQNTLKLGKRKTGIIYYDCTNFFFEMEEAEPNTLCQYGKARKIDRSRSYRWGYLSTAKAFRSRCASIRATPTSRSPCSLWKRRCFRILACQSLSCARMPGFPLTKTNATMPCRDEATLPRNL